MNGSRMVRPKMKPKKLKSNLEIWECNVRGIRSKIHSLQWILNANQPDIIVVCETHLKDNQTCKLIGYQNFYHGRKVRQGGGIIVAVHATIAHQAVMVHKGEAEVISVRLSHTSVPVTVIAVYGKVGASRDQSDAEWDEILSQFRMAKARGDYVIVCGDLNRQVGDVIRNNKLTVDYGGRLVREELEQQDMVLLNSKTDRVVGGPATWVRPGNILQQQSAIDLWLSCQDLAEKVQQLTIDSDLKNTPYRVTKPGGRRKVTYTDHRMTSIIVKDINRPLPLEKYQAWSWKEANWNAYKESSRRSAGRFSRKIQNVQARAIANGENLEAEELDKIVENEMKKLAFKHFKKVTVKKGGDKRKDAERKEHEEEAEEALEARRLRFQIELDRIAEQGAHVGQIYKLREIIMGNKKKVQQTPAAIKDPDTGEEIYNTAGIKGAINRHVSKTLSDLEPEPRYAELAAARQEIIDAAAGREPEERIQFTEEDMVAVLSEMRKKNKSCHHPVTKLSEEFLKVLLAVYNLYAKKQAIPASFTETSLTMLKKPKGAASDLNSYRFIHTKKAVPRLMEALMTSKLKPKILQTVSKFQLGGMPGTRPEEHLYTIKVILNFLNRMGLPAWLAAYDMSKFFDVESHSDATVALVEAGVQGALMRLYQAVTSKNRMQVLTAVGATEWFGKGPLVPQGSSYGALLSALNLDTGLSATFSHLLDHISEIFGLPLLNLIFQDDIIKMSTSRYECQLSQHAVAETITSKQLRLNESKCKIIVCGTNAAAGRARREVENTPVVMNGTEVETVTNEKYLGDWLSSKTPSEAAWLTVSRREAEIRGPVQEVVKLSRDLRATFIGPTRVGLTLWNSVILQKLIHNCCTWIRMAQKTTRKLERIQLQFLKKLYSLPMSAPNAGTWWISGCLPLSWKVLSAKFKFVYHLTVRGSTSVAGRVWQLEKEGRLPGGLLTEITEANRLHNIPLPDLNLSKQEYGNAVNRAVFRAAYHAVREAVQGSSKCQLLWNNTYYGAELNDWHDKDSIHLAARAKLSCIPEFGGDWGRQEFCECGEADTFRHAASLTDQPACNRYTGVKAAHPNRLLDDNELLNFTKEVIRIREREQERDGLRAGG